MADLKISELPLRATLPDDPATSYIAIVVNGTTKKIALSTILAAAK